MNSEETLEPQQSEAPSGCSSCGSSFTEPGYPTRLCYDCRQKFIRFPIPNWIKAFGFGVGIVLVFALISLPKQLSLGVKLQRGKNAIKEHRFLTAEKELKTFTEKVPASEEGLANLLIASFYNQDFETFGATLDKLEGKNVEDQDLFNRVDALITQAAHYFPTDTNTTAFLSRYDSGYSSIPDTAFANFMRTHEPEFWVKHAYASKLFENTNYTACDSMVQFILKEDPEFKPALRIMATMKRMQDSLPESLTYCDRMLRVNKEDREAMCMKARTLIKLKKDKEALEMINQALAQNKDDAYAKSTLALAYHFSNKNKQRDELIQELKQDSTGATYVEYVTKVVEGKEKF